MIATALFSTGYDVKVDTGCSTVATGKTATTFNCTSDGTEVTCP